MRLRWKDFQGRAAASWPRHRSCLCPLVVLAVLTAMLSAPSTAAVKTAPCWSRWVTLPSTQHEYKVFQGPATHEQSEAACKKSKAILAEVDSIEEAKDVSKLLKRIEVLKAKRKSQVKSRFWDFDEEVSSHYFEEDEFGIASSLYFDDDAVSPRFFDEDRVSAWVGQNRFAPEVSARASQSKCSSMEGDSSEKGNNDCDQEMDFVCEREGLPPEKCHDDDYGYENCELVPEKTKPALRSAFSYLDDDIQLQARAVFPNRSAPRSISPYLRNMWESSEGDGKDEAIGNIRISVKPEAAAATRESVKEAEKEEAEVNCPCKDPTVYTSKFPKYYSRSSNDGWLVKPGLGAYKMVVDRMEWSKAHENCEEKGAKLAVINCREEQDAIAELFDDNPKMWADPKYNDRAHVGYKLRSDTYVTKTGLRADEQCFTPWAEGRPKGELCVHVNRNGELMDGPCASVLPSVCEADW